MLCRVELRAQAAGAVLTGHRPGGRADQASVTDRVPRSLWFEMTE